jgi:hypothetical protein
MSIVGRAFEHENWAFFPFTPFNKSSLIIITAGEPVAFPNYCGIDNHRHKFYHHGYERFP